MAPRALPALRFLRLILPVPVLALLLLWSGLREGAVAESGAQEREAGAVAQHDILFLVAGPNDGEPIEGKVLRLRLTTNYSRPGTICVLADSSCIYSQPYHAPAPRGEEALPTWTTTLSIDLEAASRNLSRELLDPDRGSIVFTACMFSSAGDRLELITYQSRTVAIPAPSLGFSAHAPGSNVPESAESLRESGAETRIESSDSGTGEASGDSPSGEGADSQAGPTADSTQRANVIPAGSRTTTASLLRGATYYMILASADRNLLLSSPEEARVILGAQMLGGGFSAGGGGVMEEGFAVDGWLRSQQGRRAYLVLWSYSAEANAWRRSPIYATR